MARNRRLGWAAGTLVATLCWIPAQADEAPEPSAADRAALSAWAEQTLQTHPQDFEPELVAWSFEAPLPLADARGGCPPVSLEAAAEELCVASVDPMRANRSR